MKRFILAGYQQSLARQLKKAVELGGDRFGEWSCVFFPSEKRDESIIASRQVEALCQLAEANEGAHIFAVSTDRERQNIEYQIRRHFRFRWLDAKTVSGAGGGHFEPLIQALCDALVEEDFWVDNIQPIDFGSP